MSISWLGLLARLLAHADKLDDIGEQLRILFDNASTLAQRGSALQALIGLLVPIVETIVPHEAESEEAVVEALKLGDGRLLALLKLLYDSGILDLITGIKLPKLG